MLRQQRARRLGQQRVLQVQHHTGGDQQRRVHVSGKMRGSVELLFGHERNCSQHAVRHRRAL